MEKLSVIIPSHDAVEKLIKCLKALEKQENNPINEVIIVDDGSIPPLSQALKNLKINLPIKFVRHNERRGASAARNTGAREAKNDLIAFIDADCIPCPKWSSALVGEFNGNTDCVGGPVIESEETPLQIYIKYRSFRQARYLAKIMEMKDYKKLSYEELRFRVYQLTGNIAYKRKVYLALGGLSEGYRVGAEDYEFRLRFEKHGYKAKFAPEAYVYHIPRVSFKDFIKRDGFRRGAGRIVFFKKSGGELLEKAAKRDRLTLIMLSLALIVIIATLLYGGLLHTLILVLGLAFIYEAYEAISVSMLASKLRLFPHFLFYGIIRKIALLAGMLWGLIS